MLLIIQTYPLFLLVMTVCGLWVYISNKHLSIALFALGMGAAFVSQVIAFNVQELSQSANMLRSLLEATGLLVASISFLVFTKKVLVK